MPRRMFQKEFMNMTRRELVQLIFTIGDKADEHIAQLKRRNQILKARLDMINEQMK